MTILWIYCTNCNCDTEHAFICDLGIFEFYRCRDCGKVVRYAVR